MKIMMKYNFRKEIIKEAFNDIQHQNNAHPKKSLIDCVGVQFDNAQNPKQLVVRQCVQKIICLISAIVALCLSSSW